MSLTSQFPQAKLIFPLDLSKKYQPVSSSRSPGILTLFSHSFSTFLADLSSSFSARPETSRRVFLRLFRLSHKRGTDFFASENFFTFFCGTRLYFLLIIDIIEDGVCNVSLRLVKHALLFHSSLLHYYHHDFCSHPHIDLSFTKKLCPKKSEVKNLKSAKIKFFWRFSLAEIQPN